MVKNYLEQNFIANYEPGKTRLLPKLEHLFTNGVNNAEKLRKYKQADIDSGVPIWELNPYLTIDKLVKFIYELK